MNNLIIISGPSGSGQDSVIEGLEQQIPIERVITTTTRAMRVGETNGHPYYFISEEEFAEGLARDNFFEHACQYNGKSYGVTFAEIERVKRSGRIGIWKMDYQGVMSAKKLIQGIVAILIFAPLDVLKARIERRDHPTPAYLAERMAYSEQYFAKRDVYDYAVENKEDELASTVAQIRTIIAGAVSLDKNTSI